jgi:lipopolysaccharide/colanic/teichoic acid biosynthesis glycosyltransferase
MIKQFVTTGIMYKKRRSKNNSTFVKIIDDPRVTKVGKFIRNSIDEPPQLINVLKGDMSIVGNRPLPVYEAELITAGDLSKGFSASITGLWQVELRGKGGKMSENERMRLDNEYADQFTGDNYSFWYIKLIFRTIPALLKRVRLKNIDYHKNNMKELLKTIFLTITVFSFTVTKAQSNNIENEDDICRLFKLLSTLH